MRYIAFALAVIILAGSSCKSKSTPEIAKEPEIVKEKEIIKEKGKPASHKKRMPPGHAKKMHGAQSARDYTPGHSH